jgi:hypothetical protein
MPLPYPIAASQTDAQSPVDDNLMDSIRLDLDYLNSLFSGGNYDMSFGLDGQLIGAYGFKRAVDVVPLYKSFTPVTCRFGLRKSGSAGTLQIDIRQHNEVSVPIIGIDHQYDQATQSITNIAPALATQSISLVTPAISTQTITFAKSAINVNSIILLGNNRVRYNLATAPDSDWAVGDSVTFASCTSAANNGTFTIVEVNQSGFASVVITNASGVAQTSAAGNAQLQLMSYNFTNPVSTQFVAGEQAVFAGHTSANNNGTLTIYQTNQLGNNIWIKKSNGVAQGAAAGTASVGRWVYTYTLAVTTPDFTVGESAKMATHTNALNNGNFRITAINLTGNNLVVYNPAGVAQGAAAGTANTNRWIYSQPIDPSTQFTAGDFAQMEGHTTAANNGRLLVVQVNRSALNNLVIYNEAGVAQAGIAGNSRHTRKLIKFATDQSAIFTTLSFIEIVGTVSGSYLKSDGVYPFSVLQVNRGGGSNYNVVVDLYGAPSQASPAGFVQTEMKSIFTAPPSLAMDLTGLEANEWIKTSSTAFIGTNLAAGTFLGLYVLNWPSGNAETLRVTLHS